MPVSGWWTFRQEHRKFGEYHLWTCSGRSKRRATKLKFMIRVDCVILFAEVRAAEDMKQAGDVSEALLN